MASGFLRVQGTQVVDEDGTEVILRGAAVGGWMNCENFITGYPGHEFQYRAAMLSVLGQEKYEFFFDKWLTYHFTASDAKFYASLGLNCLRIPFNYRHFEDDMNPRVLKESGFKHLDRVIELCAKEGIYTILDMHTVPGGQNPDWHSDNPTAYAAFWDYKDHQDRTIWLWEQIASRYKSNPWIAGYNPINEPCDPLHHRLPAFYDRISASIRAIDPEHILWLDGNTFSMEWKSFTHIIPNSVYALHDYSMMGFPTGEKYTSHPSQNSKLEAQFRRKADFMVRHSVPIWNGEFGPVYADPTLDPEASATNEARIALLAKQLEIYDRYRIHWSIWLYKDIGLQGIIHTSPTSPWNTLLAPFLAKKRSYQLDAWGKHPSPQVSAVLDPLVNWIDSISPSASRTYPTPWATGRHVERAVLQTFLAGTFVAEFAELFRGKSFEELDQLAGSFRWEECVVRAELRDVLVRHARVAGSGVREEMGSEEWEGEGEDQEEGDALP